MQAARYLRLLRLLPGLLIALAPLVLRAASPVDVVVETNRPGLEVPKGAVGLSFETSLLAPNSAGARYFRPDNQPLLRLFRTLGIGNLRIGGNSVDDAKIPLPKPDDVRSLFQFARAAGVKVIYSVRLHDGDPQSAAQYAKLIHEEFSDVLESFAIGNEPGYYKDYSVYLAKWKSIQDAILAVYPQARFCGPDQNPDPKLITPMVKDLGAPAGRLFQITQHSYPFGCSYQNPSVAWKSGKVDALIPFDAAQSRLKMLSPEAYQTYEYIQRGMAGAVAGTPVTYRLSETNSFWFSGLEGASDRYAAAIWAADYLHWWVLHGAAGLNFHTGDRTGGSVNLPCRYAAFVTAEDGYEVRPLSYGLKLYSLAGDGRTVPVKVTAASEENLAAYANQPDDKSVTVTLLNKTADRAGAPIVAKLRFDRAIAISRVKVIFLTAKNDDLAGRSEDVLLGEKPITRDGRWEGEWKDMPIANDSENETTVTLRPASAAVMKFELR